MDLYLMQASIQEPNGRNALEFSPPSAPINFAKKRSNFDARSCGDCLNFLNCADDIEFHYLILCRESLFWQVQLTDCGSPAAATTYRIQPNNMPLSGAAAC